MLSILLIRYSNRQAPRDFISPKNWAGVNDTVSVSVNELVKYLVITTIPKICCLGVVTGQAVCILLYRKQCLLNMPNQAAL